MGFPWPVYHSIRAGWALTTNHTLENIPIQAQGRYLLIFSILNKQGEIILGWLLVITQCEKKIIRIANRHILLSIHTKPMNYHPEVASGCFWTSERSLKNENLDPIWQALHRQADAWEQEGAKTERETIERAAQKSISQWVWLLKGSYHMPLGAPGAPSGWGKPTGWTGQGKQGKDGPHCRQLFSMPSFPSANTVSKWGNLQKHVPWEISYRDWIFRSRNQLVLMWTYHIL